MKEATKGKKITIGVLFGTDVLLSLFFLVTSIIMMATMPDKIERSLGHYQDNYIGFLQQNPNIFQYVIVMPMLTLFFINGVIVILYFLKSLKNSADK